MLQGGKTGPRLDGRCGDNFGGAPCALTILPGNQVVAPCCNHDLGECGTGSSFCECDTCVDQTCIQTYVGDAMERLAADAYEDTVFGKYVGKVSQ